MLATPFQRPQRTTLQRGTFLVLFALAVVGFWTTVEPLWVPVFLGLTIAVAVHPLHEKLCRRWHPGLSAAFLTAVVLIALLGLLAFLVFIVGERLLQLLREAASRYQQKGTEGLLGGDLSRFLTRFGLDPAGVRARVGELAQETAGYVGRSATKLLSGTFSAIFTLIFTALTSYYLLLEGNSGTAWLIETLPLPDGQVQELVRNIRDVTRAMLVGTGVSALYQGTVAFFGYWIAGLESPLVWASLTGIASILPGLGTALVWAPLGIAVIAMGHVGKGVLLLVWGAVLIVFVADYILRPKLVGAKMRMNDLLVFIAIFGGIEAFGIMGLLLGPVMVAVFLSLVRIYQRDYRPGGPPDSPDPTRAHEAKES